jgi:hypothetical protein
MNREIEGHTQLGRLAMRQEGNWWVAYYAEPDTMKGALRLGKVHMRTVPTKEREKMFMDLMREAVADILEEAVGVRPTWGGPEAAPESERSGSA